MSRMEEKKQKNKKNKLIGTKKMSVIKIVLILLIIAVVLIIAILAWFTMNQDSDVNDMNASSVDLPFEIQSTGAAPSEYQELFGKMDSGYGLGTRQGETDTYRTGESSQIWWMLDENDQSSYSTGFQPGSSGELNFEIVPKSNGAQKVNCKFGIRTFISTVNAQTDAVESITEINDNYGTINQKNAKQFIDGHLLFFLNKDVDANGHAIYSGLVDSDGIDIDVPAGGMSKEVTIYWKWINTFDQIFLKTSDTYYDYPLIADGNSDDRDKLIEYIRENYEKLFLDIEEETIVSVESIDYDSDHTDTALLNNLNDGYNAADQIIGMNLNYFLIEMTASVCS